MEGSNFVTAKRGRSTSNIDADIIKIKEEMVSRADESKDDELNDEKDPERNDDDVEGDEQCRDKDGRRKQSGKRQQSRRHFSHGCHLVEGKMGHGMEDYLVATRKKTNDHELGLYGIFDGHSGSKVSEYLAEHLFDNILNEPDFWTNPKAAIKRAYESTDNDIIENVVGSRGGSTAVTAILIDGEVLVVANVGDSRAVICKNGAAMQITVEHEPLKERKMVESKGGSVSQRPVYFPSMISSMMCTGTRNVPRVDGKLAVTRAFGDERLKDHITSEPDIAIETIDANAQFVILASDGLWKVMSNQEAVDCIRGINDGQEAAEALIEEALSRETEDDISCVVVVFHD